MTGPLAPRLWGAHLLALVLVGIAVALGYWQLESWQARRDAEALDLSQATPVPLADLIGPDDPFPGADVGRPVEVAGSWVPSGTVFVSGREHEGRDGYWMVTPLAVGDGAPAEASALPVVLGWVAEPGTAPAPPTGPAQLTAYLQPTEGTGAMDTDPDDDVLPQLRIADVIQVVDQDLYGAYAIARDGVDGLPPGDLAALPEVQAFTALRNLLYAVEWWIFGAFAAFIWWRYVRDQVAWERAAALGGPDDDSGPDAGPDGGPDPEPSTPSLTRSG